MILQISLTKEQEERFQEIARSRGLTAEQLASSVILPLAQSRTERERSEKLLALVKNRQRAHGLDLPHKSAAEILEHWSKEDSALSPEELARENAIAYEVAAEVARGSR